MFEGGAADGDSEHTESHEPQLLVSEDGEQRIFLLGLEPGVVFADISFSTENGPRGGSC